MALNRRDFIRYSGMAGATLAFGFCSTSGRPQNQNSLGIALLGLGSYSTGQLAPALQQTKHCHLAGIVTGSPWKIPKWQKNYGIKDRNVYSYDTMENLADNDEIDVVYIVVPTGLHAKYAIRAAEAGKHVFCEKPMAMNVEECDSIIRACESNGVRLAVGYRMQHEANTQTVMKYANTQPYGTIKSVHAEACYAGGPCRDWRCEKDMGGGALYDMGVYCINGIRYATAQEPTRVLSARQYTSRPDIFTEVDETTEFEWEFASGIKATAKTSVGQSGNILRVDCAGGWYQLKPMQSYSGVQGRTSSGKKLDTYVPNQQARQMDDDALAIMNQKPMMVPGEEGRQDIHIVQKILECSKTGQPVDIG